MNKYLVVYSYQLDVPSRKKTALFSTENTPLTRAGRACVSFLTVRYICVLAQTTA
ncbi:MAG: hypothetical protein WCL07_04245 [bacterium]